MRTIALWIAAALAASAQSPTRLTVLSYNIHHGESTDGKVDLERIAAVIRACLTGLDVIYGRAMDYDGGLYGNAVLTRLPVDGFTNHAMPFTPGREPRAVMVVEAAGKPEVPALLAGDMNGRPDSRTLEEVRKAWRVAGPEDPLPTAPAGSPRWRPILAVLESK